MANVVHAKEQRYDRQLRLWGDRGQEALEKSKICLIGAGVIGSELLKNLVLPGLGNFTIVDSALVTTEDLGNNFFTTESYLGKPRAQAVTELVSELNRDVKGSFVVETMDELLEHDPNFFLGFNAIVYTDIRESNLLRLSRVISSQHIPIIVCNCVGFIGYLRVSILEHAIIESHPDSIRPDFRLDNPIPGLTKLAKDSDNDLEKLSARDLVHIPWLIIIHKFVERFRLSVNRFPTSYADKQEVKKSIIDAADELVQKCRERGETLEPMFELTNFHEAAKSVNTAIAETRIPDEIAQLFDDCRCIWSMDNDPQTPSGESLIKSHQKISSTHSSPLLNLSVTSFWKLISALKEFTFNEGGGLLPVRGDLPDMTAGSERYLKLLHVYRESADWAVEQLASRLSHVEGLSLNDIRVFARNSAFLKVVKGRSLEEELKLSPARSDDLHFPSDTDLLPTHEENSAMLWYFVLRAAASFVAETNRWPGQPSESLLMSSSDFEMDLPIFRQHVNRVLTASGLAANRVCDDYVHEMCRFGGGEIHSIAAFMAGMAAQEVIKLVTHQFVPICQPLIYNGITQKTEVLQF